MDRIALPSYEESLLLDRPLAATSQHGDAFAFDVRRWLATADAADATVVRRCIGPVLDIGCGPGRMVQALIARGTFAVGLDIAEVAVRLTQARGAPALRRSVFDRMLGEGQWRTALLIDGNIGIGGDPRRLLHRVAELVGHGGRAIVELDPTPDVDRTLRLRFTGDTADPPAWFDWAVVGLDRIRAIADDSGFRLAETWSADARAFAMLIRA